MRATMKSGWHLFEEKKPPEEVVLLVNGPLGLDLAMKLEDSLYFKKGDDWSESNLEHWSFNTPTQWAELTLAEGRVSGAGKNILDKGGTPPNQKQ